MCYLMRPGGGIGGTTIACALILVPLLLPILHHTASYQMWVDGTLVVSTLSSSYWTRRDALYPWA